MPVYTFTNKETGDQFDLTLSYNDMLEYLKEHPEVDQVFRMNIVDPVGIGITKPPSDFLKNVVGKVKEIPGADKSAVERRWAIPKEI